MGDRYRLRPAESLEPDQRALYDTIVGGPRGTSGSPVPLLTEDGSLLGPFGPVTLAPAVGDPVQALGAALRFATGLSDATREAAILLVAAHHRSEFEWFAHAPAALAAGIPDAALIILRSGEIPGALPDVPRPALAVVRSLLRDGTVDDELYGSAVSELGERGLAELVWLVGYYAMLALALAVFDPPNPNQTETVF
jgi:4-carboxymuconolactone decarboxylase